MLFAMETERKTLAEIGRDIRALRGGTSRERAAANAGISARTLAAWENGEAFPSRSKFEVYAQSVGVDPDAIIPPDYRPDLAADINNAVRDASVALRAELDAQAAAIERLAARVAALEERA